MSENPTEHAPATEVDARIHELASEAAARHGAGAQPDQGLGAATDGPGPGTDMYRPALGAILKALDASLMRRLGYAAHRITRDAEFTADLIGETRMSAAESDLIADAGAQLLANLQIDPRWAPLIGLTIGAGGYSARVYFAFRKLEEVATAPPNNSKSA